MLTSLYIHIPFCTHICTYCDFHKEMAKPQKKERYIRALNKEITFHKGQIENVKTIYIGGGTPSSLKLPLLEELLVTINKHVLMDQVVEFTIETNPNDITKDFVDLIMRYNVNRISIGIQTFDTNHLKFLGRTHTQEDVFHAITILKESNFENISVDMMFSLTNQTMEELEYDLQEVLQLPINHLSYYSLILEEKSKLYYLLQKKKVSMNSEELEGLMYNKVINTLLKNGFNQYEISSFEKGQNESLHNKTYWLNKEYLGLGTGSHSMYDETRYFNPVNVTKYIEMIEKGDFDFTTSYRYDSLNEEMMLGLRLTKGIHIQSINEKYQIDIFERFPELDQFLMQKIIEQKNGYLRFTREGILLGNLVFQIFVEVL